MTNMTEILEYIGVFLLEHKLFAMAVALVCLIIANTLLGAVIAGLKMQFKKEVLIRGILKHSSVALAIFLIYVAGLCVPNLQVTLINENAATILEALDAGFLSALAYYAVKVFKNLFSLFGVKTEVQEITPTTSVPTVTELADDEVIV